MTERIGHRGYVGSRSYFDAQPPQRVQNIVIRDYATRNGLHYLLSAVEYAMPGCHMMLGNLLDELSEIEGVICYSIFMLPVENDRRLQVYARFLENGATLHGALDNLVLESRHDIARIEDIWLARKTLDACPVSL